MRPCHFFLRREGVLGIGHLVVFLFHQCITYCNKCKLCSKWRWRRYTSSVKWSLSDLNESLGSRYFLYVMNERTSFASWASIFERLVIGLKWTSDQKVAYVFVTFEWNKWELRKDWYYLFAIALFQSLWWRANTRNVSFFIIYGGQFTSSTQLLN